MKFCEHCGVQLEDNEEFCGECGTRQLTETENTTKKGKKKVVIISITVLLIVCIGTFIYLWYSQGERKEKEAKPQNVEEVKPSTLREGLKWEDNSEKVEAFKKEHISGYPDSTIGDALKGDYSVSSWKYASQDAHEYLMCNYSYEEQIYMLVFYRDSYDNVNVAEYYIKDDLQAKEITDEVMKKIFTIEKQIEEDKETDITPNTMDNAAESSEEVQNKSESVPDPSVYPEGGVYTNSRQGGAPYITDIEILPRDKVSFSYTITRTTGETGNESLNEVLLSGIMTHDINLGADSPNKVYFSDSESGAYIAYYDNGYVDNGYGATVHNITVALGGAEAITSTAGEQFYKYWIRDYNY